MIPTTGNICRKSCTKYCFDLNYMLTIDNSNFILYEYTYLISVKLCYNERSRLITYLGLKRLKL